MTDTISVTGFVAELVSLFPMSNKNAEGWIKRYVSVLNEVGLIDFKRLWRIFEDEYISTVTPPSPKWLKDAAIRSKIGECTGNLEEYKTLTCVTKGGIYEFAYRSGYDDKKVKNLMDKYPISWIGKTSDCPTELKAKVDKMTAEFQENWACESFKFIRK